MQLSMVVRGRVQEYLQDVEQRLRDSFDTGHALILPKSLKVRPLTRRTTEARTNHTSSALTRANCWTSCCAGRTCSRSAPSHQRLVITFVTLGELTKWAEIYN